MKKEKDNLKITHCIEGGPTYSSFTIVDEGGTGQQLRAVTKAGNGVKKNPHQKIFLEN